MEYWEQAPPVHELLAVLARCFTSWEPASRAKSTSPEEIAAMISSPKGFGGAVLPMDALPAWMLDNLDAMKQNA